MVCPAVSCPPCASFLPRAHACVYLKLLRNLDEPLRSPVELDYRSSRDRYF